MAIYVNKSYIHLQGSARTRPPTRCAAGPKEIQEDIQKPSGRPLRGFGAFGGQFVYVWAAFLGQILLVSCSRQPKH